MIDFGVRINPVFAEGRWFEIDTLEDIKNAEKSINEFN